MTRYVKIIASIMIFVSIFCRAALCEEKYLQVQAAIDIATTIGDGRYTLSQIADIARQGNVKIVIAVDGFFNRWQYGLWPFRTIITKMVETGSVVKFGIRRYLDGIKQVERDNPDMIFVSAVTVAPFYWWDGSLFGKTFSIKDWHRHILVIGLDSVKDYAGIPMIGNGLSLAKPLGFMGLAYVLLCIGLIWIGFRFRKSSVAAQRGVYERLMGLPLKHWKYIGTTLIIIGTLLLINGFPYRGFKYDQYHGDRGAVPYQNLIDYVNSKGGTTFWAHPEAKNVERVGNVNIETSPHEDFMLTTYGYTGFAIFYEGYDRVGAPGLIWDETLKDYCKGIRPSPVWAIGSLGFEKAGNLGGFMKDLRTTFLIPHFTKEDVVRALKEGRMYVSKEKEAANFVLEEFSVKDMATGTTKVMGQELRFSGVPRIHIQGRFADKSNRAVTITLIRRGEVIRVIQKTSPFGIDIDDENAVEDGKSYYRAEIRADGLLSVTNPIFVTRQ